MNKKFKDVVRGLCVLSLLVACGCSNREKEEKQKIQQLQEKWFDQNVHTFLGREDVYDHVAADANYRSYLRFDSDGNTDTTEVVFAINTNDMKDRAAVWDLKPGTKMTGKKVKECFSSDDRVIYVLDGYENEISPAARKYVGHGRW